MPNSNNTNSGSSGNGGRSCKKKGRSRLSPQQIAVIAGLLANALTVESVLISKDQDIQVLLSGSLRRKTKMDQMIEEMSGMSVGDLMDAIMRRS